MSYTCQILLVFLCGMAVGLVYFSGLMLTIIRIRSARKPGLFLMASFVVRVSLVLAVFFAVSSDQWQKYVACIIGFLAARQMTVILWSPGRRSSGKEKSR